MSAENDFDKDLFGVPVTSRTTSSKSRMRKAEFARPEQPAEPREKRVGLRFWMHRFVYESFDEIAVKATAHFVVPFIVAVIAGVLAQVQFDWIGKSRTTIGEWTTTVKRVP